MITTHLPNGNKSSMEQHRGGQPPLTPQSLAPKSHCPRLHRAARGRGLSSVKGSVLPGRERDRPDCGRRREGRKPKAGRHRSRHWLMACHVRRPTRRGDPLQSFERPPRSSGFGAAALSAGSTRVPSGPVQRDGRSEEQHVAGRHGRSRTNWATYVAVSSKSQFGGPAGYAPLNVSKADY